MLFDKRPGWAEVDVVEQCQAYLWEKYESGEFILPDGVPFPTFAGSYENQLRAAETLSIVLPAALFLIFLFVVVWAFLPSLSHHRKDASEIPFRNETATPGGENAHD